MKKNDNIVQVHTVRLLSLDVHAQKMVLNFGINQRSNELAGTKITMFRSLP